MDLETENKIAAILMKEAAELRQQAEKEGVHAYLCKPTIRGRPNSRFLSATVLGVEQANRAVEVNEMWRVRQKELDLDDKLKGRLRNDCSHHKSHGYIGELPRSTSKRHADNETNGSAPCSSSRRVIQDHDVREGEGLRDDEVGEFLHSRIKRGRGAVGSRMDETGPYLSSYHDSEGKLLECPDAQDKEERVHRVVFGPEKPSFLIYSESSEESLQDGQKKKKSGSRRQHSRKNKSKEKSREKKKRGEDRKICKHHK